MCGVDPTRPAETMVKNSSSEASAVGAEASMWGTLDWWIVPPWDILSAMRTRRLKAAVRAFSFTSLAEITTSERMEGMKCKSVGGTWVTTTEMAARRSRRAGAETESVVVRRRVCNSELRDWRARMPVVDVAKRGRSL